MSDPTEKIEIPYSPNDFLYMSANTSNALLNCGNIIVNPTTTCPTGNKAWLNTAVIENKPPYNITVSTTDGTQISGNTFIGECLKKELCANKRLSEQTSNQLNKRLEQKQSKSDSDDYLKGEYVRTANYAICIIAGLYIFFKTKASSVAKVIASAPTS